MNKKNLSLNNVISHGGSSNIYNGYVKNIKDGKHFGSEMTTSEYKRKIDILLLAASEMIKLENNK